MPYTDIYKRLDYIRTLEFNWDEDEALAMDPEVVDTTTMIVKELEKLGQPIFNLVPGPNSEIVIVVRNEQTLLDLELLIEPKHKGKRFIYLLYSCISDYTDRIDRQSEYETFDINVLKDYLRIINAPR